MTTTPEDFTSLFNLTAEDQADYDAMVARLSDTYKIEAQNGADENPPVPEPTDEPTEPVVTEPEHEVEEQVPQVTPDEPVQSPPSPAEGIPPETAPETTFSTEDAQNWAIWRDYLQANPEKAQEIGAIVQGTPSPATQAAPVASPSEATPEWLDKDDPVHATLWQVQNQLTELSNSWKAVN